jgi:hypothetical protein
MASGSGAAGGVLDGAGGAVEADMRATLTGPDAPHERRTRLSRAARTAYNPRPARVPRATMNDRLVHFGCLRGTVADVIDAGVDVLPHFEMAAISILEGTERPAEWPQMRRRLRAEGLRLAEHRGVLLLTPGDLERAASIGILTGSDELFLCPEWIDEFEVFPGRIGEGQDFTDGTPLGLDEWMIDTGCIIALGDGVGLNYATLDAQLDARLHARYQPRRG